MSSTFYEFITIGIKMYNGVSLGLQMNDYDAFLRINSTLEN